MTILLVEDDPTARRLLATLLRGRGYDVRAAPSGHGAVHLLCAVRPDLVILDLDMPDVSGVEVLRLMKQERAWSRIPVIVYSGGVERKSEVDGLGAQAFVEKGPGGWQALTRTIAACSATAPAEACGA